MSIKTTTKQPFKYRINALLIEYFGATQSRARLNLMDYLQISRATLSADINIPAYSEKEIPQARLISYASFFGLSVEDLKTNNKKQLC